MRDYNKVILMGHLSQDPEYKELSGTNKVANFTIAVNRQWTNSEGDEMQQVSFIDCMAFGGRGKTIADHFTKGRPIFVEGRLKQEKWTDKETGKKQSKLRVVVENFSFIDSKKSPTTDTIPPEAGNDGEEMSEEEKFDALVD